MSGYEVVVVGGGHAGCEAALAAARLGCRPLLITQRLADVAAMPCNPAVGGPGKAHLVREIDALGGQMGLAVDAACLQMRTLNTSKGPAVRALRAQVDGAAYRREMARVLLETRGLDVAEGEVVDLRVAAGRVTGVVVAGGRTIEARTVVLATGVYLNSRVITGEEVRAEGPSGRRGAVALGDALREKGLRLGRFKTGTSPRISRTGVDEGEMQVVWGDERPGWFSFLSPGRKLPAVACWLTHTTPGTHRIIRRNLARAPLFDGTIEGQGPRHCPSIEDKVARFPGREGHQVFLEPLGADGGELYILGLSTSLPVDVQEEMIHSVPGLRRARMLRPGYAIEYDYLLPAQLRLSLEVRGIDGLYAAGQINGTSGYEEAAAQGLVAGINAAGAVRGREPLVLDRAQAYIGVLVDDLVNRFPDEPYRMLTSRCEYRLLLRCGNADRRLTPVGTAVGLAEEGRSRGQERRWRRIEAEVQRLKTTRIESVAAINELLAARGGSPVVGRPRPAQLLRRPGVTYEDICALVPGGRREEGETAAEVEAEIKYEGYIHRQLREVEQFRGRERVPVPDDLDYDRVAGLSAAGRERLALVRPASLGQALRIPGVTPADAAVLAVHVERLRREEAGGDD